MDIALVKAKYEDIAFLVKLRKLTMVEHLEKAGLHFSDDQHMSRVKIHFDNSYIIQHKKKQVGVLKYIETSGVIDILQLQILPKYQGKGMGKHVLNHMIKLSEDFNKKLTLKVLKENPARYLYKRNGFTVVDEDEHEFYMEFEK
ncbi:GNAT family N-acetyltransferase [Aquimarina sp. M1]